MAGEGHPVVGPLSPAQIAMRAAYAVALSVANIDAPATELALIAGANAGEIRRVHQVVAGADEWTEYAWDNASSAGTSSPYRLPGSSGQWRAVSGKYQDGDRYINGTLTLTGGLTVAGTTAFSGAFSVVDGNFSILGSGDATKIAKLEVDGFTTGTTRTFTLPNASITVAGINLAQTFSATQTFAGIDATSIGATTRGTGLFTTLGANGAVAFTSTLAVTALATLTGGLTTPAAIVSTLATGTAPFTVASTTVVANLNASLLLGSTWAAPGTIGSGTPSTGAFTTISATGVITSTLATGTAPFTVASTTVVGNLNVSQLLGGTWAVPGTIGSTTANTGKFTTLTDTGLTSGRVTFASTGGLLADSANLTWDGTVLVATTADATIGFRVAGATGRIRVRGYVDATQGAVIESANTAESLYLPMTFGATAYRYLSGGVASFLDTTDASAVGTASVVLTGGLSVAKASYLGSNVTITNASLPTLTINNTTTASSSWALKHLANGDLQIIQPSQNTWITFSHSSGTITSLGPVKTTDGTASTSASTGALVVGSAGSGGLGVAGAIFAGGNIVAGTNADPFSRSYGRSVVVGGTGSAAVTVNAATGTAAHFDLGVNGTRYCEFTVDTSSAYFGSLNSATVTLGYNGSTKLTLDGSRFASSLPIKLPSYAVASLPSGQAGDAAFASNGRKNGEGGGAGTGVLAFHDGTAWRACDTGATVAA
jgi:hypothetical protein